MSEMRTIIPGEIPVKDLHQYLLGSVAPRPIAFVSTMDPEGVANLAPYSFYNAFSSNPPIVVFSSNRRVADNTTKDTLQNIQQTGECVINAVNYSMIRQMAVASVEFPGEISEFDKTGLTPVPSSMVKPYRVKESPVHLECRVREVITLGDKGGAGHLVICDVLCLHVAESVIDEKNRIDPHRIDLMGRLGRAFYVRASGPAVHTIVQPVNRMVIGYDALPESIRSSQVLSANHLGLLAGLFAVPNGAAMREVAEREEVSALFGADAGVDAIHELAARWLDEGKKEAAGALLYLADRRMKDQS
jgi:flavin reductase (DIM6/NTAB) family NADH-FMN oxidoreductase RutF